MIFDALDPQKLSVFAKKTIAQAEEKNNIFCCAISLWEIAMLIQKNRLQPGVATENFLDILLHARNIQVLSINTAIAALSTTLHSPKHFDPADRLIAATTIHYQASLITSDKYLQKLSGLATVW